MECQQGFVSVAQMFPKGILGPNRVCKIVVGNSVFGTQQYNTQ